MTRLTIVRTSNKNARTEDGVVKHLDAQAACEHLPWRIQSLIEDPKFKAVTIIDDDGIWQIAKESVWNDKP